MKTLSRKPEIVRRYVIKLQPAVFHYVQNTLIDVSKEYVVFIFRVQVELIGELKMPTM